MAKSSTKKRKVVVEMQMEKRIFKLSSITSLFL